MASALVAEGYRFKVFTPAGSVRLASDSSGDDYIEFSLDPTTDPPACSAAPAAARGRGQITSERPFKEDIPIADLADEDVLAFLLEELTSFLER